MVHLWDKVKDIEYCRKFREKPNFESIQDTLKDIIGYAIIGIVNNAKMKT